MSAVSDPALDPDAALAVIDHLYDQGWSDGLPLAPATESAVARFLSETSRDPDEIVAEVPQLGRTQTVRDIAVHAVMAGCLPAYLPVVLAAWDALSAERSVRGGGWQSTSGPGPLLIVNGEIRHRLGFNSTGGVFGPGFRPNMTIPRSIGLAVRNGFGIRPHEFEQATQGIPGRWNMCIAEDEENSPWEPLSVELGLQPGEDAISATLLRTSEFIDNRHFGSAEEVLRDFADSIQRVGPWIFTHSAVGLVINPEHARLFAAAGMSKQDVREWLVERAGRTERELTAVGKGLGHRPGGPYPPEHFHPVFADATPSSLPIVVAGAPNAAISMVVRLFSASWAAHCVPIR